MWLYGCLSEDTEVLTKRGWKRLRKTTKYDRIKIYDITNNIYKWETPERWQVYRVNEDTAYRIKGDTTDQIVSKEHNCLVEREGKLVFKQAWELDKMETMPTLPQDFFDKKKGDSKLLLKELLWKSKGLAQTIFSKWQGNKKPKEISLGFSQSSLEGRSNLFQKKGKLWQVQDKVCQVSKRLFGYGSERRLCYGTQIAGSSKTEQMLKENRSNTPQRPQPRKQQDRELNVVCEQPTPQTTRSTVTKIKYSGLMFCPTVSTGAFIARRNSQVFITGNSGFPKATDISKQLDKKAKVKRNVIGTRTLKGNAGVSIKEKGGTYIAGASLTGVAEIDITEPATPEAKLWNGWKSHGLKPAYEPILVAMKPNEGSYANNALKHGVSGLNIDGGRISHNEPEWHTKRNPRHKDTTFSNETCGFNSEKTTMASASQKGRFPANLILDSEAAEMLDKQSGESKSSNAIRKNQNDKKEYTCYGNYKDTNTTGFNDKGGASRFFYVAKSSRAERNMGCEGFDPQQVNDGRKDQTSIDCPQQRGITYRQNNHPTVKPLKLMEYLCRLTKTPTGGIVLDPFVGSGTTCMAAKKTGRPYIGIEKEEEYIKIAEARIKAVPETLL